MCNKEQVEMFNIITIGWYVQSHILFYTIYIYIYATSAVTKIKRKIQQIFCVLFGGNYDN